MSSESRLSLSSLLPSVVPFGQLTDALIEVFFLLAINGSSHLVSFVIVEEIFFEIKTISRLVLISKLLLSFY